MLSSRSTSVGAGPRLHDYSVPINGNGGLTQLRPGLIGVPTGPVADPNPPVDSGSFSPSASVPVPVPNGNGNYYRGDYGSLSGRSESWGSPARPLHCPNFSYQAVGASASDGTGGWSLPRSSVRSVSASSRSRSKSVSDEEEEYIDVGVDPGENEENKLILRGRVGWKTEEVEDGQNFEYNEKGGEGMGRGIAAEEEWDGMDMDMEMD
jgi:hypothetical protein